MRSLPTGDGISVTALQLATAYSVMASGGVYRAPRVVTRVGRRTIPKKPGLKVVSAGTADTVRQMLAGAMAPGKALAGLPMEDRSGSVGGFVGIAPPEDPRIVVLVVVRGGPRAGSARNSEAGSRMAEDIARLALPYLGTADG